METYKLRTKVLGIPVPGYGQGIWPEMELQKFQMIENMLLAGMKGMTNCIFTEGSYSVVKADDGTYTVKLGCTSISNTISGVVNGAYFSINSRLEWSGLVAGNVYFLHLKGSSNTFQDSSDVSPVSARRRQGLSSYVLLAKVDLQSGTVLDSNPEGKLYAKDYPLHVVSVENPHSDKLIQDELLIRKKLAVDEGTVLEAGTGDETTTISLYKAVPMLAEMMSQGREVVDFVSGGKDGVVVKSKGIIDFVTATISGKLENVVVGEISVKYDTGASECVVYNTGDSGITLKALIFYRR